MWKKIAIAGAVGAAIVGVGTAALAETGSTSASPSKTPAATATAGGHAAKAANRHKRLRARLGSALHGTWVTKDGSTFVTHDAIRGAVTAVSPTSIQVKAADGVSETYVVNSATKVHRISSGKPASSVIGDVKTGDTVVVTGTGTGTLTAKQIVDRVK